MVETEMTRMEAAALAELPISLQGVIGKLPTPEATQVIKDIGRVGWIVDNNNNNNKKEAMIDSTLMEKRAIMSTEQIKQIKQILGP